MSYSKNRGECQRRRTGKSREEGKAGDKGGEKEERENKLVHMCIHTCVQYTHTGRRKHPDESNDELESETLN